MAIQWIAERLSIAVASPEGKAIEEEVLRVLRAS